MIQPELSRRVSVNRIGAAGMEQMIEADAGERLALARRLQIPAIASMSCRFRLGAPIRGEIAVEAELRAEVTQVCVVSLDPFEATVRERFALRFVPQGAEDDDADPESLDELPYSGDMIDLGETASEQLALALDPYPRMPGLVLPAEIAGPDTASGLAIGPDLDAGPEPGSRQDEAGRGRHPFAALAHLRSGKPNGGGGGGAAGGAAGGA